MALFKKRTKKYSMGVKALDEHDAEFIDGLNQLHAAMLKGQAQRVAGPLFKKLMDQMYNHFSTEEQLMKDSKFPGLAEHSAEHRALAAKVEAFVARYEQGDQTMYPQLLRFGRDWLRDDMQTGDKEFTAWMNEHGVH